MTETTHDRGLLRRVSITAVAFAAATIVFLWSWNTIAVELFGLPAAQFKHAFAIVAGLAVLPAIPAWTIRLVASARQ